MDIVVATQRLCDQLLETIFPCLTKFLEHASNGGETITFLDFTSCQ